MGGTQRRVDRQQRYLRDVEVIRNDIFTTVKLDGVTVLENEPQGDLAAGGVGAITHWARSRVDDLSVMDRLLSPP